MGLFLGIHEKRVCRFRDGKTRGCDLSKKKGGGAVVTLLDTQTQSVSREGGGDTLLLVTYLSRGR